MAGKLAASRLAVRAEGDAVGRTSAPIFGGSQRKTTLAAVGAPDLKATRRLPVEATSLLSGLKATLLPPPTMASWCPLKVSNFRTGGGIPDGHALLAGRKASRLPSGLQASALDHASVAGHDSNDLARGSLPELDPALDHAGPARGPANWRRSLAVRAEQRLGYGVDSPSRRAGSVPWAVRVVPDAHGYSRRPGRGDCAGPSGLKRTAMTPLIWPRKFEHLLPSSPGSRPLTL